MLDWAGAAWRIGPTMRTSRVGVLERAAVKVEVTGLATKALAKALAKAKAKENTRATSTTTAEGETTTWILRLGDDQKTWAIRSWDHWAPGPLPRPVGKSLPTIPTTMAARSGKKMPQLLPRAKRAGG